MRGICVLFLAFLTNHSLSPCLQYLEEAFGAEAFLRLDGNTNRIIREMNVRIDFSGKSK